MSSSIAVVLILIFLCVSSHACTARPLTLTIKATANYHSHERVDKVRSLDTLTAPMLEENHLQHQAKSEINVGESCSRTSTLKRMTNGASGTSFQMESSSFPASKEERRHGRSMMGPSRHHVEETVVTNAGDTTEDIVEMDYAQPHRKPPIHNEKP